MRSCLVVDDSATVRRTIAAAIRAARKGVQEVHEAEDPAAALALFESQKPDVVFLDMMLAGDDPHAPDDQPARGLGVLRSMLALRPDLPVVVVTGLANSQPDVVDAISLGAVAALRKPVKPEEVKYVLDAIEPDASRMDYFA
ncbi:MAG TPA: response regulator [Candidatus Thermoplasmatota archaeon]|nr:response regulator [Candidatus Thermoplasmatota archaeon]